MDFGIGIATSHNSWKLAQRAEELGFTHAWFFDTQMITADCFVAMGAAAMKTSRIRLGTGVLVPSNRIAAVTANAFATLNGMAPGRIDFGVGTGFSARRAMGLGAMKLADMEEYIRVVYGLLNGETLETNVEGKRKKNSLPQSRFRPDQHTRSNTAARIGLRPKVAGADGKAACRVEELRLRRAGRHDRTGEHAA